MRLKIVALLFFVFPLTVNAQYSGTYAAGTSDITSFCTSGTNCWKQMVGANIIDFDEGGDGQLVAAIYGGSIYVWDYSAHTWNQHTELGTGYTKVAVQDQFHIFLLKPGSSCTAPDNDIYLWDGTHAPTLVYGCLVSLYVSKYGPQMLVGTNSTGAGFYSTNTGQTWTQSSNFNYATGIYLNDSVDYCAVKSGVLYTYQDGNGGTLTAFSPAPSGTIAGCVYIPGTFSSNTSQHTTSNLLLAWTTAGAVKTYDFSKGTWATITGTLSKIVGPGKGNIIGISGGTPYHYNVVPSTVTLTMAGKQSTCPPNNLPCPQNAIHKVTAHIYYPHDLNGQVVSQSGSNNDLISASSTAVSAKCDQFFGTPGDSECTVAMDPGVNNQALCEVSGVTLATPPQLPQWAASTDAKSFDGSITAIYSEPLGPGGYLTTVVCSTTLNGCKGNTLPTCPTSTVAVEEICGGTLCDPVEEEADAQAKCSYGNQPNTWIRLTPYLVNEPNSCIYALGADPVIRPESFGQVPCD